VESVTLSTTVKNKARLARKKAKEDSDEPSIATETKDDETKDEKMNVDGEEEAEAPVEEKKKKKREPEPLSFRLSNPCRITKSQAAFCEFDLDQRYRPVRIEEKPCGVILLTDSAPDEEEDIGTVKPPSIESEDEADAPEPFEWSPPGADDSSASATSADKSTAESAPTSSTE